MHHCLSFRLFESSLIDFLVSTLLETIVYRAAGEIYKTCKSDSIISLLNKTKPKTFRWPPVTLTVRSKCLAGPSGAFTDLLSSPFPSPSLCSLCTGLARHWAFVLVPSIKKVLPTSHPCLLKCHLSEMPSVTSIHHFLKRTPVSFFFTAPDTSLCYVVTHLFTPIVLHSSFHFIRQIPFSVLVYFQ